MSMKQENIIERFESNKRRIARGISSDPIVYCFGKEYAADFDQLQSLLNEDGWKLIDVNQALVITPEDYSMPLTEAGYVDPSGKLTINDILKPDEVKRWCIIRGKCRAIVREVDGNSVLVLNYNDQILNDQSIYETVRSWLKDGVTLGGVVKLRAIKAIVYLETDEKLRDFCRYGIMYRPQ